ncbi:MAG: hypothetical protein KBD94_11275 [Pyrinomonadaceae bacterium]|nr:hypothetical protein [Pyrinomonadaceae bacterium]
MNHERAAILNRGFEKFRGGPASGPNKPCVPRMTINSKGTIYLNSTAYNALGRPSFVSLYYSRKEDTIAVEPAAPPSGEDFPVGKKQMGWVVHASSFCRHYRIKIPGTRCFITPEFSPGIVLLNLGETTSVCYRRPSPSEGHSGEV